MAKSRADRFQSAAEVAGLLHQFLAHLEHPDRVPPPPPVEGAREGRRRRRPLLLAGLLLGLVGAAAVFLARTGSSKDEIRRYTEEHFGYFLDETLDELQPTYHFDVSCQGSVPQSILAFLERPSCARRPRG